MGELLQSIGRTIQQGLGLSSSDSLEYQPLPTKRHIRLLDLKQSQPISIFSQVREVVTTIEVHELDNVPPFSALSYTWGDAYRDPLVQTSSESSPKFVSRMTCNGRPVAITENLYDALSTFVSAGITGVIWVDALCINQTDSIEKGNQVAMMGDIYSRATEVLIWLGPYREEVEHFVYTIRELLPLITEPSNRRRLAPWFKHESLFDDSFWEECFYMGSPLGRLTKFALFYASCRWFSRAWTMQETFLARRSRMFCGEVIISVSDAIDLANVLASCKWHSEINISLDKEGLVSNLSWLNELAAFSSFDYVRQEEFDQHRNRWNEDSSAVHALAVLLSRYRYSGCSDPRDKVYSLLSIVNGQSFQPSVFNFIKPDYTVSVEEVFTKVTKLVLEKSRSLDYLAEKRLNLDNNSSLSLPSWVVDHSLCRGVTTIIPGAICKPRYDACLCGSTTYPQFSVTDSKIHCHGSRFDVVADIMTPMTAPPESATGKFPSLSFWTFFLSLPPFINGRPRFDVVWKTLTVGANPDDSKIWVEGHFKTWMMFQIIELAKPTHGPASSSVLRDVMNQLGSSSSTAEQNLYHLAAAQLDRDDDYCVVKDDWIWGAMEFREAAATIVKERRLFTTERGLLAKTTRTLRKGDEVWMLCDAHVPFVLRPTARTGEYEVIGDCYVNGFMNGEMLEDRWNVRENIGSLTIV